MRCMSFFLDYCFFSRYTFYGDFMKYYVLKSIRILAYIIVGIILIIGAYNFLDNLLNYLNLIVGIAVLYGSTTAFVLAINRKAYKNEDNHVGTHFLIMIFSIIIILSKYFNEDLEFSLICTLWGISAIITGSIRINGSIYDLARKELKGVNLVEFIESVVEIVLAVVLILNPEEHVKTHIVLLGASNILFAIILLVHEIKFKREVNKVLDK